jgi:hypothetical protein
MTTFAKPVGIALSGAHLALLLADRALTGRLNAAGLPFAVAGIDRVDRAIPRADIAAANSTVESAFAAATLADWAPDLGWLTVAAVDPDSQYDVARRVASADRWSGGRSGLVLGLRDWSVPAGRDGREAWEGGLTPGLPAGPAMTRDAAAAIRALWRDWSADPVLAWRVESTGEAAAARRDTDIVIWPAGRADRLGAIAAASSGGPRLFVEMPAGGSGAGARLAWHLADDRVSGVILRPEGGELALYEFIMYVLPELAAAGLLRASRPGTLRERLDLPVPGARPAAYPALPAPEPALTSAVRA